jgi:Sec7-like guanine-nucleotide exchange factor
MDEKNSSDNINYNINYNINDTISDNINDNITLDDNMDFVDALFVLQDYLSEKTISDNQNIFILETFSEKIKKLNKYKEIDQSSLFILLYVSIMLYNDLANPDIKHKIKLNKFINMLRGCNNKNEYNNDTNFPTELLNDIYNKIYNKIKELNIKDNILDEPKRSCVIL